MTTRTSVSRPQCEEGQAFQNDPAEIDLQAFYRWAGSAASSAKLIR